MKIHDIERIKTWQRPSTNLFSRNRKRGKVKFDEEMKILRNEEIWPKEERKLRNVIVVKGPAERKIEKWPKGEFSQNEKRQYRW